MKKENRNRHDAGEFEIRAIETRILCLRGKQREEAMTAYRKLLDASRDETVYLARY
jgi:hypothetical protein